MQVKVTKVDNTVVLPGYKTKNAAGFDFVIHNFKSMYEQSYFEEMFCEEVRDMSPYDEVCLEPGDRVLLGTGLKIELPENYELQVRPRSGLALKHGLTVLNSPGTVDADYRGEIGVILINNGPIAVDLKKGDRIAQGVFNKVVQCEWVEEVLSSTERGENGFGSTGVTTP